MAALLAALLTAYLIGAIPTSVWLGRWIYGADVRQAGSGNAGATNTFRVLGARAGVAVLLFDVFKGMLAIWAGQQWMDAGQFEALPLVLGYLAAFGHIFPVYLRFRGGKGVATFFGSIIYLFPLIALLVAGVFVVMFLLTRVVSLASLTAAAAFPLFVLLMLPEPTAAQLVFAVIVTATVVYTHRQNIVRLLKGTEPRLNFTGRSSRSS